MPPGADGWETISAGVQPKVVPPADDGWETVSKAEAPAGPAKTWKDYTPLPLGDAALALGSGAVASAVGGLAGLRRADNPFVPEGAGAEASDAVRQALTYEPRTATGHKLVSAITAPFEWLARKADQAGGAVTDATGSPGAGAATNAAVQSIPAVVGKVLPVAARAMPKAPVPKAPPGYALTPDEAGAGLVTRTAANIAGEPKLAKTISAKNQPVHNEKIAADLGLPPDTPLTPDAVRAVRKQAGQQYEAVRNTGQVTASAAYGADLDALAAKYAKVANEFPELAAKDVQAVIDGARKQTFSADAAVDLINQLRSSADDAFASRQSGLGKVYRGVSDALEAELGRHIQAQAQAARAAADAAPANSQAGMMLRLQAASLADMLPRFQAARTRIAQAYMAEKALGGGENINPSVYVQALAKNKPLTGGAQEVAQFAKENPRSALPPKQQASAGGPTWSDAVMSGVLGKSLLTEAPLLFARPIVRNIIASGPYQRAFVRNPGMVRNTIASDGAARALGIGPILGTAHPEQEESR